MQPALFKDVVSQCTSYSKLGCALCWLLRAGHGSALLGDELKELVDDWFSMNVAKARLGRRGRHGSTFPLREGDLHGVLDRIQSLSLQEATAEEFVACWRIEAWTYVTACCLNRVAGFAPVLTQGRWTSIERRAIGSIAAAVRRRCAGDVGSEPLNEMAWQKELCGKQVSYSGEEMSVCYQLTWDQVVPALPPEEHGGCVNALDWVGPATREFLLHPSKLLKDPDKVELPRLPGKIHVVEGDRMRIAFELVRRRICDWVPLEKVYSINGVKILNGLFGVKKSSTLDDGRPILRLIMNLTGSNSTQLQLEGGCRSLPMITSWQSIILEGDSQLELFQSDMSSALYLFRVPDVWKPHLAFNIVASGFDLGLDDDRLFALSCAVIPMGWLNSVGVMQEISENLLKRKNLNRLNQVMRGKHLPIWFNQLLTEATTAERCWWHVYLDNFCAGERVDLSHPGVSGKVCHDAAESAWRDAGVVSSEKKRIAAAQKVTELGAEIDGELKTLGVSTEKICRIAVATLWLLKQRLLNKKHLQILAGRWVFVLQFRRPAMVIFDKVWKVIGGSIRVTRDLRLATKREMFSVILLSPLLHCNLGAECSEAVVATDASETGGAVGISSELSNVGRDFVATAETMEQLDEALAAPILIISLFNGIGGAFRCYDVAGILPMGRIAVDIDKAGNRITEKRWPGTEIYLDIRSIDSEIVRSWARRYLRIAEVHVWAGFPCNDLSSARAGRMNLDGPASILFWEVPRVLKLVKDNFGAHVVVKYVLENVASMDREATEQISTEMGSTPYLLDPVQAVPMRRPRHCWSSEILESVFPDIQVYPKAYWKEVVAQAEYPLTEQWLEPDHEWKGEHQHAVFPTCMKCVPKLSPPYKPAGIERCSPSVLERWTEDKYRYPPYQYRPEFIISTPDTWRLLSAPEKELLMGFGFGHTQVAWAASAAKQNPQGFDDARHTGLGESFSIVSFAIWAVVLSKQFLPTVPFRHLVARMGLAPGFRAPLRFVAPLKRCLQYGSLSIPPAVFSDGMGKLNRLLLRKTNHTGSDVRLASGEIIGGKVFPRQSVASVWWLWQDIFSKRWEFKAHINVLEMRAILAGVKHQVEKLGFADKRIFQLSDSFVCISIISKGRTSSDQLSRVLRTINCLLLAHGLQLVMGHVDSFDNPTDKGSRL